MAYKYKKNCNEMPEWRQWLIFFIVVAFVLGFIAWLIFLILDWFEPMAISFCIWGSAFWAIFPATGVFPDDGYPF